MQRRALVVVNPQATTTTALARNAVRDALARVLEVEDVLTDERGHASELAAKAAADGTDIVVAFGGDGTINEVVNGLLADGPASSRPDLPVLGIVPGGSTNVLARSLGLPRDPVRATGALVASVAGRSTRSLGLGQLGDRWFTFSAGFGIDAQVVQAVEAHRVRGARSTPALWIRTGARHLLRPPDHTPATLTLDDPRGGVSHKGLVTVLASNSNPWTYLGRRPLVLSRTASFDRGLDVLALRSLDARAALRTAGEILVRRTGPSSPDHIRLVDVGEVVVRASSPVACQVDGDFVGMVELTTLCAVPHALSVLVPRGSGLGAD